MITPPPLIWSNFKQEETKLKWKECSLRDAILIWLEFNNDYAYVSHLTSLLSSAATPLKVCNFHSHILSGSPSFTTMVKNAKYGATHEIFACRSVALKSSCAIFTCLSLDSEHCFSAMTICPLPWWWNANHCILTPLCMWTQVVVLYAQRHCVCTDLTEKAQIAWEFCALENDLGAQKNIFPLRTTWVCWTRLNWCLSWLSILTVLMNCRIALFS